MRYFEFIVSFCQDRQLGLEISGVLFLSFAEGALGCSILCSSTLAIVSLL